MGQRPGLGCRTCGCIEHVQLVSLALADSPPDFAGRPTYQPAKKTATINAGSQSFCVCLRVVSNFDILLEVGSSCLSQRRERLSELCLVACLLQLEGEQLPPGV